VCDDNIMYAIDRVLKLWHIKFAMLLSWSDPSAFGDALIIL